MTWDGGAGGVRVPAGGSGRRGTDAAGASRLSSCPGGARTARPGRCRARGGRARFHIRRSLRPAGRCRPAGPRTSPGCPRRFPGRDRGPERCRRPAPPAAGTHGAGPSGHGPAHTRLVPAPPARTASWAPRPSRPARPAPLGPRVLPDHGSGSTWGDPGTGGEHLGGEVGGAREQERPPAFGPGSRHPPRQPGRSRPHPAVSPAGWGRCQGVTGSRRLWSVRR